MTARLRNVNPLGAVDLPLLGRVIEAGEEFDVSEEIAGKAPSDWRPVTDDDKPEPYLLRQNASGVWETYDPGFGLLAQVGNFEAVEPATKTPKNSGESK